MKTFIVIAGVILIICGLIGFGYAAITTDQTNAIIGWVVGLILIIIKSIIEYRLEDYGNMKAVGLLNSELKKPLRLELIFYFAVSIFTGFILGYSILIGLIEMYSYVMPGLQLNIYPISYIYYVLNIVIMLIITYIYNIRKIKKLNIADIMRMKTFG